MKLNRRGFTLIELLVTIVIIGLVVGLSIFGIFSVINNSEEKAIVLSEKNIKNAANLYSAEMGDSSWKKNSDFDAFCVTVGELMNKGFLDKKSVFENDTITKDTFVIVKRNNITFSIMSEELVSNEIGSADNGICTGQSSTGERLTEPTIKNKVEYTDKIEVSFDEGEADSGVKNYKCLYGESSSSVNKEGRVTNNSCILDGLKNFNDYYVMIYMNTNNGSSILATGDRNYKTSDFVKTTIYQIQNKITINYSEKDTKGNNINNPTYYFKSTIDGTSNINLEVCTLKDNIYTCSGNMNDVKANTWYKTNNNNVEITYPEITSEIDITTRIYDGSNNYKENRETFEINKYVIKFYRNTAKSIDGKTNDYIEKYCISEGTSGCNIISPSIEASSGTMVVGWGNSSSANTSSWNVGASRKINSNASYYAITKGNTYTITYDLNGGSVSGNPTSYTVESDSITLKNPTKQGYSFIGWTGSNGNTPNTSVTIPKGSTGNKTYTANWEANTYTITYDLNGGSVSGNPTSYTVESDSITLKNPTKRGYTFVGWTGSNGNTPNTSVTIPKGSTGNKTYTANWEANTYTITYNANGGSGAPSPQTYTYALSGTTTLSNTIPTRSGYTFLGWSLDSGATSASYSAGQDWGLFNDSNYTLYAVWKANTYTITYNANGGSGAPSPQTAVPNVSTTLSTTIPYKVSYNFNGWNTKSDGTGTNYYSGASYTGSSDVTLYAKWTEHEHSWHAIGTKMYNAGSEPFTCGYAHSLAFARYCETCGMSYHYYRHVLQKGSEGILACPCTHGAKTMLEDSNINYTAQFGITGGQAMLTKLSTVSTALCSEHMPVCTITAEHVGYESGRNKWELIVSVDNYFLYDSSGKQRLEYSWTSKDSGYSNSYQKYGYSYESYHLWVKDIYGNIGTCNISIYD